LYEHDAGEGKSNAVCVSLKKRKRKEKQIPDHQQKVYLSIDEKMD